MAAACVPDVSVQSAAGIVLAELTCSQCLTVAAESTAAAAAAVPGRQVVAAAGLVLADTAAVWPAPAAAHRN